MSDYYEFTIPTWSVTALAYGDYSGLNDDDIAEVERFNEYLDDLEVTLSEPDFGDDYWFAYQNDMSNLGTDVCKVTYHVME